jgi:hypothetical protein
MFDTQFDNVVLPEELRQIRARRAAVVGTTGGATDDPHQAKLFGLSFSGGGIRSATLNLGILQGLADLGLLKFVDYLSTVSGGGYIGGWLHGVIRNRCGNDPQSATDLLSPESRPEPDQPSEDPISFLRKYSNYLAPRPSATSVDTWVIPLIWLRNVSLNQLILIPALAAVIIAPLLLVFVEQMATADSWGPFAGSFRNIVAALALVSLAIANTITWKNLVVIVDDTLGTDKSKLTGTPELRVRAKEWSDRSYLVVPLAFFATFILACGDLDQHQAVSQLRYLLTRLLQHEVHGSVLQEILKIGKWLLSFLPAVIVGAGLLAMFPLLQGKGGFFECYMRMHGGQGGARHAWARTKAIFHLVWMPAVSALVTFALIVAIWHYVQAPRFSPAFRMAFGPPLVCGTLLAGVSLLVGLMGTEYADAAREWLARIGARLALTCAGWMALFVIAIYGPPAIAWLLGHYGATTITAGAGWVATTAAGVFAGRSAATGSSEPSKSGRALRWLLAVAPPAFMIGYLLLISFGVHQAFVSIAHASYETRSPVESTTEMTIDVGKPPIQVEVRKPTSWLERKLEPANDWAEHFQDVLDFTSSSRPLDLLYMLASCVVVALVASRRINVNEFSMHHFYKNRLVRCYLGASNGRNRHPNTLTGFDPKDDFPLSTLTPGTGYLGPYAIVNTTLNLNAGVELSLQERKGASFVFTPKYCGWAPSLADAHVTPPEVGDKYLRTGYRPTLGYSGPEGPALGSVTAISGAAANPNSGYSTSGPMAFLLTVFDARLGWWLGNTRWQEASKQPGPNFALWYLLAELLGQTTARSRFINLSDGGHFDNLGLYELVRRRCRYIIVCDGEEDGDLTFGSLGGAIRKCRADFGVEIDINPDPIRLRGEKFGSAHCVMGTITYPETASPPQAMIGDAAQPATEKARGWLLYLKSSLTGDEPTDVMEYHSRYKEFPHQSTADQFFSESQFESYRRLGLHIVRSAFEETRDWRHQLLAAAPQVLDLDDLFQRLTRKWYAPTPVTAEAASRLANSYSDLMQVLRGQTTLQTLVPDLLPRYPPGPPPAPHHPIVLSNEILLFGTEVIQLIENVYTEYELEFAANRANPRNNGWMNVFRRWAEPGGFLVQDVWPRVKHSYNPLFQQFMDQLIQQRHDDVPTPP